MAGRRVPLRFVAVLRKDRTEQSRCDHQPVVKPHLVRTFPRSDSL